MTPEKYIVFYCQNQELKDTPMATKNTRSGGVFGGSHTTLTNAAIIITNIAEKLSEVIRISPGHISSGLRPTSGSRRVKIVDLGDGKTIRLFIRDNITLQQVTISTEDKQKTMLAIAKGARNKGVHVSFGKNKKG